MFISTPDTELQQLEIYRETSSIDLLAKIGRLSLNESLELNPEQALVEKPKKPKNIIEQIRDGELTGLKAIESLQAVVKQNAPGYRLVFAGNPNKQNVGDNFTWPQNFYFPKVVQEGGELSEPYPMMPAYLNASDAVVEALLTPLHPEFASKPLTVSSQEYMQNVEVNATPLAFKSGDYWVITGHAAEVLVANPSIEGYVYPVKLSETHPISIGKNGKRLQEDFQLAGEQKITTGIVVRPADLPDKILVASKPGTTRQEEANLAKQIAEKLSYHEFPLGLAFECAAEGITLKPLKGSWPTEPRPFDEATGLYGLESLPKDSRLVKKLGKGVLDSFSTSFSNGYRLKRFDVRQVGLDEFEDFMTTHIRSFIEGNPNPSNGITEQAVREFVEATNFIFRKYHEFLEMIRDEKVRFVAAFDGPHIVGLTSYTTEKYDPHQLPQPWSLAVLPEHWGNRISTRMFAQMLLYLSDELEGLEGLEDKDKKTGVFSTTEGSQAEIIFGGFCTPTGKKTADSPPWAGPNLQVQQRWERNKFLEEVARG